MRKTIRFDVFGKFMTIERRNDRWLLLSESGKGIKSPVAGVEIPSDLEEEELAQFLDDIFHEHASVETPAVIRIKGSGNQP